MAFIFFDWRRSHNSPSIRKQTTDTSFDSSCAKNGANIFVAMSKEATENITAIATSGEIKIREIRMRLSRGGDFEWKHSILYASKPQAFY